MNDHAEKAGSSRAAAVIGILIAFLGGYVLGSMGSRGTPAPLADPAKSGRKAVPVGLSPAAGPADALVTVVEFADFQCGYCAQSVPVQKRVLAEYGQSVRWVFKHLPLGFHASAQLAAEAATAAHAQGRFWEYHDRLFEESDRLEREDLLRRARVLGLDMVRFTEALEKRTYEKVVQADKELAAKLKIDGTPNFFVNGRHIMGAVGYPRFEAIVREEIAYAHERLRQGVQRADLYHDLTKGGEPKGAGGTGGGEGKGTGGDEGKGAGGGDEGKGAPGDEKAAPTSALGTPSDRALASR